jgi:hypothetical protein
LKRAAGEELAGNSAVFKRRPTSSGQLWADGPGVGVASASGPLILFSNEALDGAAAQKGDGTFLPFCRFCRTKLLEATMHGIIYLIGLIVVVLFILSFFGLR